MESCVVPGKTHEQGSAPATYRAPDLTWRIYCSHAVGVTATKAVLIFMQVSVHRRIGCSPRLPGGAEHRQLACMPAWMHAPEETMPACSGNYVVVFDPLDGSCTIDAGISTGSIFGIYVRGVLSSFGIHAAC